ncbi:MAG: hypothetical protein PHP57_07210 [Sideroxydans sp.]|nr:hypothetical protein [Sideroxydans sp.]
MTNEKVSANRMHDLHKVDANQELALRIFRSYYRSHQSSGKLLDDFPEFFLVKPSVLDNANLTLRSSEKLIMDDCVQRARQRNGFIGVSKWRNPKLNYYWLEMSVFPYILGDDVNQNNQGEFFYLLSEFVEYTKNHPKPYGDLTAGIDSDKDLELMLSEINRRGEKLDGLLPFYSRDMLVKFNPNWPVGEVKKLLDTLKGSDQRWCDLFFEHIIYVMGKK